LARILGIDYGGKRTGLAVTDEMQIIVSPLDKVSTTDLLPYIETYLSKNPVEKIVFGYPRHKDGNNTYLCEEIDGVIAKLQKLYPSIKIDTCDEEFSSRDGMRLMQQSIKSRKKRQEKGNLDMYSAVVILRRHLGHE